MVKLIAGAALVALLAGCVDQTPMREYLEAKARADASMADYRAYACSDLHFQRQAELNRKNGMGPDAGDPEKIKARECPNGVLRELRHGPVDWDWETRRQLRWIDQDLQDISSQLEYRSW